MSEIMEFFFVFLRQFAGGPGPAENNLVRFGLPAILWGVLFIVAWKRNRSQELPREKLLVWGFGLGFAREAYMFFQTASHMLLGDGANNRYDIYHPPLEHALSIAAIVVVAGAFLLYVLDDRRLSNRYLQIGLVSTAVCLFITLWIWPARVVNDPGILFHQTWGAWLFHILSSVLIAVAIFQLSKKRGWLRNVVIVALMFFFLGEFLLLLNYATDRAHSQIICPIGNTYHMLAIPLLGYVYMREQSIEKKRAEKKLEEYSEHLEDQVQERTASLISVNKQLKREMFKREKAEIALEQLAHQNELILESAGEGICGLDLEGKLIFVNPAAAKMLGYRVEELIGGPSHKLWYDSNGGKKQLPDDQYPIHESYRLGVALQRDDQVFWRKDGTNFPIRYNSSPTYVNGKLAGAVVVFRDITERKNAEVEIAQRNARLAAQNAVAATLSKSLELETILNTALDTVLSVLEMDVGLAFLINRDTRTLRLRIYRGSISPERLNECKQEECPYIRISNKAVKTLAAVSQKITDFPDESMPLFISDEELNLLVSTPLVSKGRVLGALTLGSKRRSDIQKNDMELLTAIGQQIGMAVENARLYLDAELYANELGLLHQVSLTLASTLDSEKIYDEIARQSAKLTGCNKACVIQYDRQKNDFQVVSSFGLSEIEMSLICKYVTERELLTDLSINPRTVVLTDLQDDPRVSPLLMKHLRVNKLLCLPIIGVQQPLEILILLDQQESRQWRRNEIELIESFVNRAAIALENAFLHRQIEWAAALEERYRIAADMHDGLAQTLSLLGLKVDETANNLTENIDDSALEELKSVRDIVEQASAEVRRSIASLQETPQPPIPLKKLLKNLSEQYFTGDKPAFDIIYNLPEPLYLSTHHRSQVIPIVQEALINAHRHANAQCVNLVVDREGDFVKIIVEDDGSGFDMHSVWKDSRRHFGLQVMRARAARIGGNLQIQSMPGLGTLVALIWKPESVNQQGIKETYRRTVARQAEKSR
jgi:PAS domain S-box-containing protein